MIPEFRDLKIMNPVSLGIPKSATFYGFDSPNTRIIVRDLTSYQIDKAREQYATFILTINLVLFGHG